MSAALDSTGHFPGCTTAGCAATRCADARYMRDYGRALSSGGVKPRPIERWTLPCARCKAAMHPAQNSRRIAAGFVCMACYDFEMSEPRCLREPPRDDPSVN